MLWQWWNSFCLAPQTIILPYFRDIISQRSALYLIIIWLWGSNLSAMGMRRQYQEVRILLLQTRKPHFIKVLSNNQPPRLSNQGLSKRMRVLRLILWVPMHVRYHCTLQCFALSQFQSVLRPIIQPVSHSTASWCSNPKSLLQASYNILSYLMSRIYINNIRVVSNVSKAPQATSRWLPKVKNSIYQGHEGIS